MRICLILIFLFSAVNAIDAQKKRALLVGVSNYEKESGWTNIHGSNDVDLIYPTLKKQGFTIKKLTNESATAHDIRHALSSFSKSCTSGDYIYLHFSCHGQPVEDVDGDEEDGWDEALVPVDAFKVYKKGKYSGENHITDDELNGYLRAIRNKIGPKGYVYVIIDACHAGSSYRGEEIEDSTIIRGTDKGFSFSNKQYTPRIDRRGKIKIEKSPTMANICILEACRSYQVNSEIIEGGKYFGSLSFYVNKVLKETTLDKRNTWTERVALRINRDMRLIRQNLVIETSHIK